MGGMRRRFMALALFALVSLYTNAQYMMHELQSHKWITTSGFKADGIFDLFLTFSDDKLYFLMKEKGTGKVVSDFYYDVYLVPRINEVSHFDSAKIGKEIFGKYIVMNRHKKGEAGNATKPSVTEILEFDDSHLVLYLERKSKISLQPYDGEKK